MRRDSAGLSQRANPEVGESSARRAPRSRWYPAERSTSLPAGGATPARAAASGSRPIPQAPTTPRPVMTTVAERPASPGAGADSGAAERLGAPDRSAVAERSRAVELNGAAERCGPAVGAGGEPGLKLRRPPSA